MTKTQTSSNRVEANEQRRKAREKYWSKHDRDSYQCPDCGRFESQLPEHFEVHHRDGDVFNNALDNLVGLCQVCHNLREGKRPSNRKAKHLVRQFSGEELVISDAAVPVCRTEEEYTEFVNDCFENKKPALLVNMKRSSEWASVEVDFITLEGALRFSHRDNNSKRSVHLSDNAVRLIQSVLERYKGVEQGPVRRSSVMSVRDGSQGGYWSFPSISLSHAKSLASELRMVIENPMHWTPRSGSIRHALRDRDSLTIEMADLNWLSDNLQRDSWVISSDWLQTMCSRCEEREVPETDGPSSDPEHCTHCQQELRWKYSECDHQNTSFYECIDCGLSQPGRERPP